MAKYLLLIKSTSGEVITHFFTHYATAKEALKSLDSATMRFGWKCQLYEWGPVDPHDPESIEAYVLREVS